MPRAAIRTEKAAAQITDSSRDQPWVPLHPMHQRLVVDLASRSDTPGTLPAPARMAAIFYVGAAGWAVVAAGVWGVTRLL